MASEKVHEFTKDNFEAEVINSSVPVLVDFWAEWCVPCRMLAPTIEALAEQFGDRMKVGKLDTEGNQEVAVQYGITAIPTVIVFKDGEAVYRAVGVKSKHELETVLEGVAAGTAS